MTLACLQYPILIISFILCGICVILAGRLPRFAPAMALIAGIGGVLTVILALVCSVPMTELLGMLLILLLLGCLSRGKGADS